MAQRHNITIITPQPSYKFFDFVMFEKLKLSLKTFGQLRPINCHMLGEKGLFCFEGTMILKAMKELGCDEIECNVFDFTVARQVQLSINELNFKTCEVELGNILNNVQLNEGLLPFSQTEIDALKKLLNFDWAEFERTKNDPKQTNLFDE